MDLLDHLQMDPTTQVDDKSLEGLREEDFLDVPTLPSSDPDTEKDAVFGITQKQGVHFVTLGWVHATVFLMKTQIGLGILGESSSVIDHRIWRVELGLMTRSIPTSLYHSVLPRVFSKVGLVPGVLMLILVSTMTTWSAYVVGTFKLRHPEVHSIADAGYILGGHIGQEVLGVVYTFYMLSVCAGGLLGFSTALNAVSNHSACTVWFVLVSAVITYIFAIIRTIGKLSFLGWIGVTSSLIAVTTTAIVIALQNKQPSASRHTDYGLATFHFFGRPSLVDATHALGSIVFAYGGVPAFFTVVAEMREPKKFHRVVLCCQGFTTGTYLLVGLVIYIFCGDVVLSPALKSAGPVFKKVCYSLASPAIIIGSIIYLHLAAKYIFVRVLRGGPHLTTNSVKHWVTWISSVTACLVVAFFVAQAVSVSEHLVGFVGALFGSLMSIDIMGMMWLYDNFHRRHCEQTWRFRGLVAWNIFMIVGGLFICIAGTYGSVALMIVAHRGKALPIFRCSDNSI